MGRDLSIAPGRSVLYSFLVTPLLLLPVLALYLSLHPWQGHWPLAPFLLGCLAIVAGMPVHEALHALGWRRWGGAPPETIRFGANRFVLYVVCTQPVAAGVYRRIIALPGLVLGVLPCLAAIVSGNELVLFFGVAHLGGAAGDALILWQVRGLPGTARVRDHGSRVGCVLIAAGGPAPER
jgi:hypothetical protein